MAVLYNVLYWGQIVTGIVSGCVYDVNSWILNVHLQLSVVVLVIFVLKVYWGSISCDMVKLRLTKKNGIKLQEKTFHSYLQMFYLKEKYNDSNDLLTPLLFHSFLSVGCVSFFCFSVIWGVKLCAVPHSLHSWFLVSLLLCSVLDCNCL